MPYLKNNALRAVLQARRALFKTVRILSYGDLVNRYWIRS